MVNTTGGHKGGWSEPMGGCDSDGNPITVSFGWGTKDGETLLGDGDRSSKDTNGAWDFLKSSNHDHYGSGNGPNNNGTERGQYTGPGSK